jgi:hypothetical protein
LPELYLRQQTERDRNPPGLVCLGAGMGLIRLRIEHLIGKHLLISHPGASVESPPAAPAVLLADHSSAGGEPAAPLNGTVDRPVIKIPLENPSISFLLYQERNLVVCQRVRRRKNPSL